MKSSIIMRLSILIMLFSLFQGIGCGTVKSAYRASAGAARSVSEIVTPGSEDKLKERIMVVPVINQAGLNKETGARITAIFMELLTKEEDMLITLLKDVETSESELLSPQYGIVINPELITKAEENGMDVLVTTTLYPFDINVKKRGIWPFRKMKKEIDISINMNVLDITNGTLMLAKTETNRIKIDYDPAKGQEDKWDVDNELLYEAISSILEIHTADVSYALDMQPWTGKISLADDGAVRINGGKDIGITEGSIFEVFDKGEPVKSSNGRDYFYLGTKTGEVRADKVMQDYSVAVPLNNERLKDGQLVRLK